MSPTRREFIKRVGIALASLITTRCIPRGSGDTPRGRLRRCWQRLEWLAERSQGNYERGEQARQELTTDHRAALDELIDGRELQPGVADELHVAFEEATTHILMLNAPVTCYEPVIVNYTPTASDQLARQAALLAEMAERNDLDTDAVAQAQAAIERDIAFLTLSYEETQALYDGLQKAGGDTQGFPPFDEIELGVTPQAAEAARFLVELLLGDAE